MSSNRGRAEGREADHYIENIWTLLSTTQADVYPLLSIGYGRHLQGTRLPVATSTRHEATADISIGYGRHLLYEFASNPGTRLPVAL